MPFTLSLGAQAPAFNLKGADGKFHTLEEFFAPAVKLLVVVFSCNHCPAVVGSEERIKKFYADYKPRGVELVAINSNEDQVHKSDSYEFMVSRAREQNFKFQYLRDDSQEIAKTYGALRTPHFYLFNSSRKLIYTGRFDDSPRDASKAKTHELIDAVESALVNRPIAVPVTNPIGCNVKWSGKDPHWMPVEACDLV